jgi:hypothetical protein
MTRRGQDPGHSVGLLLLLPPDPGIWRPSLSLPSLLALKAKAPEVRVKNVESGEIFSSKVRLCERMRGFTGTEIPHAKDPVIPLLGVGVRSGAGHLWESPRGVARQIYGCAAPLSVASRAEVVVARGCTCAERAVAPRSDTDRVAARHR